jgi:Ion channel
MCACAYVRALFVDSAQQYDPAADDLLDDDYDPTDFGPPSGRQRADGYIDENLPEDYTSPGSDYVEPRPSFVPPKGTLRQVFMWFLAMLALGTVVFHMLEAPVEAEEIHQWDQLMISFQQEFPGDYSQEQLAQFFVRVKKTPMRPAHNWDLPGSAFFAISVITSIGYGQYAPETISTFFIVCFCLCCIVFIVAYFIFSQVLLLFASFKEVYAV